MGYQIYRVGKRWGGYGVPTICEHPDCNEEIDRGVSFACGGEPFSEYGCDRYFCDKHKDYAKWNAEEEKFCDCEEDDCNCEDCGPICERCRAQQEPFDYKPEHPEWVEHLLTDDSWAEWRKNNPEEVKKLK